MESKYRVVLYCVLAIVIALLIYWFNFSNETTQEHIVYSIDKVEKTVGDSDGFTTEVYYIMTTDKGAYEIVMNGFNSSLQSARVQKDSTYIITTRGVSVPFLGIYSKVISVKDK